MPEPNTTKSKVAESEAEDGPVSVSNAPGGPSVRINLQGIGLAAKVAYKWKRSGLALKQEQMKEGCESYQIILLY